MEYIRFILKTLLVSSLFWLSIVAISATFSHAATLEAFEQVQISYQRDIYNILDKYADAMLRGDYSKAQEIMQKGIEKYPNFSPFYYNLFLTLDRQNKTEEAKAALQKFIDINPEELEYTPEVLRNAKRYGLVK